MRSADESAGPGMYGPQWRCRASTLRTKIQIRQHAQPPKDRKQASRTQVTDPCRIPSQDSSPMKEPMSRNCPGGRYAKLHAIRSCQEKRELLHETFANARCHGRVPTECSARLINTRP